MPYQQRKPRSFGADTPACPNCSMPTSLTGRGPDTDYDFRYERQIFTHWACGHRIERIVDADGNPSELPPQLATPQVSKSSFRPRRRSAEGTGKYCSRAAGSGGSSNRRGVIGSVVTASAATLLTPLSNCSHADSRVDFLARKPKGSSF
jgi:hypothetical protein